MEDPSTATLVTANTSSNTTSLLHSPDSYALRGKVMLTAIFFVLVTVILLVLILQIYFRWYLHRRRTQPRRLQRRVRQQQQQHLNFAMTTTPTTNEGLDPVILKSLPVFTFSKSTYDDYEENEDGTEVNCAVCLCEFDEGEKVKTLPGCNHSFHVECIDMWLQSHSTCPLCRAVVELRVGKDESLVEMESVTESCQHEGHDGPSSSGWNLAMLMDILNVRGCLMCNCGRGGDGGDDLESGRPVEDERRRSPLEQL